MTDLEFYKSKLKDNTIGAFISAVMAIDNPEDARRFYLGHIGDVQNQIDEGTWKDPRFSAVQAAEANIGWCFGEGMPGERITMWRSVSSASHPVFGVTKPTPEEAYDAGLRRGKAGTK